MMKPIVYDVKFEARDNYPDRGDKTWVYRGVTKDGALDFNKGAPCGKGIIKGVVRSTVLPCTALYCTDATPCHSTLLLFSRLLSSPHLIKAIPGEPDKCVMMSIEELPSMMSYVPSFMLNWLLTSFTPKMLHTNLVKYRKYKGLD
jgi:hypothetical protein